MANDEHAADLQAKWENQKPTMCDRKLWRARITEEIN